jgi:hypothetical protein
MTVILGAKQDYQNCFFESQLRLLLPFSGLRPVLAVSRLTSKLIKGRLKVNFKRWEALVGLRFKISKLTTDVLVNSFFYLLLFLGSSASGLK